MSTPIVLSIISEDRPGIVESLSDLLRKHDGNWTESSMLSLAGKFAGIVLVHVPPEQCDDFLAGLKVLESRGLHILAQRSGTLDSTEVHREFTLDLVGQDHPGIVHEITEVLAKNQVNVLELETHCESASMSGENLFLAHARLTVPPTVSIDSLQDDLEELANELMVDIKLED